MCKQTMPAEARKILILGVGNSGTRLLGSLVHAMLREEGHTSYYYEPLYWSGKNGLEGLSLSRDGIEEHTTFALLPDETIHEWPWMDRFIENLNGVAKFIRAGSRIRLFVDRPVRILWITRELHSYLASMYQNFPRALPDKGWHHRPGEYDDYERLREIYSRFDLCSDEGSRVEVEAAWWHLQNAEIMKYADRENVSWIRYEDLCEKPVETVGAICGFLDLAGGAAELAQSIHAPVERELRVDSTQGAAIEAIAGQLNAELYGT